MHKSWGLKRLHVVASRSNFFIFCPVYKYSASSDIQVSFEILSNYAPAYLRISSYALGRRLILTCRGWLYKYIQIATIKKITTIVLKFKILSKCNMMCFVLLYFVPNVFQTSCCSQDRDNGTTCASQNLH